MTTATIVFWCGLASSLLISLWIGLWRGANDSVSWMSAKRKMNLPLVTCSIISTMIGGALFVAVVVMGFENGIIGIYIGIAYAFGLITLGIFSEKITKLLDETQSETLFHFVTERLGRKVGRAYAIISVVLFTLAVAGQVLAMRHYFMGAPGIGQPKSALWAAMITSSIVVFIYIYRGGLTKDMISDSVQLIYIFTGLGLIIPYIWRLPAREILNHLDSKLYTVGAYGPVFFIGVLLMASPMLLVRADLWQRIRAAKSAKIAKWSFYISAPIVALSYCFFTYLGMLARGLGVKSGTNLIVGILTSEHMNGVQPWVISGLSIAFIGAVISTLDSLLNMTSIAYVRMKELNDKKAESTTPLKKFKDASIIIAGVVIIVLIYFSNVVDIFVAAVSFVMVIAPPILLILFGYQPNKKGAFNSIILGSFVLGIAWIWIPKNAFVPAVIIGWIVYFVSVLVERRRIKISD